VTRPVKNYKVARLSSASLADRLAECERLARRNAREGFEGYAGDRLDRVVLRFKPEAAHKVIGREVLPDGSVRAAFTTRDLEAVKPWVRAFGNLVMWEEPQQGTD